MLRTSIKKSSKCIETSANKNKHDGLRKIDIIETAKENKEEDDNNDRFNVCANDIVVEEKNEDEMETKNRKVKMIKEKGIKMNDKEIKIRKRAKRKTAVQQKK